MQNTKVFFPEWNGVQWQLVSDMARAYHIKVIEYVAIKSRHSTNAVSAFQQDEPRSTNKAEPRDSEVLAVSVMSRH